MSVRMYRSVCVWVCVCVCVCACVRACMCVHACMSVHLYLTILEKKARFLLPSNDIKRYTVTLLIHLQSHHLSHKHSKYKITFLSMSILDPKLTIQTKTKDTPQPASATQACYCQQDINIYPFKVSSLLTCATKTAPFCFSYKPALVEALRKGYWVLYFC